MARPPVGQEATLRPGAASIKEASKNLLFLKKKKQKDFIHLHPRPPAQANG
jgi:hypothetical protein